MAKYKVYVQTGNGGILTRIVEADGYSAPGRNDKTATVRFSRQPETVYTEIENVIDVVPYVAPDEGD